MFQGLKREVQEEACAEVEVGRPLIITEYEPKRNAFWGGTLHSLTVIFECRLTGDTEPRMPQNPDPNQTAVKWIPLVDLEKVELLPHVTDHILAYANKQDIPYPIYLCEPINPDKVQKYL